MSDVARRDPHAGAHEVAQHLAQALRRAVQTASPQRVGMLRSAVGTIVRASGVEVSVGEVCELVDTRGGTALQAEVIGFADGAAILMPFGSVSGLSADTEVRPTGRRHQVPVGDALLGRVLDGFGAPLDGQPLDAAGQRSTRRTAPPALERQRIDRPLATGIRAIDALTTIGEGQRVGIFAPAGVGKSTLLGMLARDSASDVGVIALIGERGREVREFIDLTLGADGLRRSVLVVATSDRSPVERIQAAFTATTIAEHFRDRGLRVMLLVDSATRLARAQREVGLASGEPPARQGFPPSVFALLPQLMERAGPGAIGSITAFYTVLAEGDMGSDPIADEVRSILDGHLVLTPKLAQRGQFPAIDPLASLSRVMPLVTSPAHRADAQRLRQLLAKYDEIELLVQLGEYQTGSDPDADEAIDRMPRIRAFLSQRVEEGSPAGATLDALHALVNGHE
jgi:type III secretion protein N (ATPase)